MSRDLDSIAVTRGRPVGTLGLLATGFVSEHAGSVASANAVLLRGLLGLGHWVRFFSKPSFVDSRPAVAGAAGADRLTLVDCTNARADGSRRRIGPWVGRAGTAVLGRLDAYTYNRGLVRAMRREARRERADVALWLGDWSRGRVPGVPTVSFVQGPPGTDARSISRHAGLIRRLAGTPAYARLRAAAAWRLNVCLPRFDHSDHVIVGSEWSRRTLIETYTMAAERVHALPYPIDLDAFRPPQQPRPAGGSLRVVWLGRFVPRKRLDLFLDGLALAIADGVDVEAVVVGRSGFVPNYEALLAAFPHPDRLRHISSIERELVPGLLAEADVMAQPSDDEDFGSSVAEALACGLPAIVGATNGTGDYVCGRSIRLADDRPATFAAALATMADRKRRGELADPGPSRAAAEQHFAPDRVTEQLVALLNHARRREAATPTAASEAVGMAEASR